MDNSNNPNDTPPDGSEAVIAMSPVVHEVIMANKAYAENFGEKAQLTGAPRRKLAILTCMDARMDPAKFAGLGEGDAHVIRNAGGRASEDAIRSLIVSYKLLGTRDWLVVHHSGCGMQSYTDDEIRHLLGLDNKSHQPGTLWHDVHKSAHTEAGEIAEWLTFTDLAQSVIEDVDKIRNHPLVPPAISIYGYIYHIHHGTLELVPSALRIGSDESETAK